MANTGYSAICSVSPQLVYTTFGSGISPTNTVYTDPTLINEVTGYDFIVEAGGGSQIYTIGTATGIVGSATGTFC